MKDKQTKALGVAVVGAGYWGKNLIRNFRSHKQFELRYVIDRPSAVDFEPSNGEQFIFDLHTAFEDKAVEEAYDRNKVQSYLQWLQKTKSNPQAFLERYVNTGF